MTTDDNSPVAGGEPELPPSRFGAGYTAGEPPAGDMTVPGFPPSYPPAAPPSYVPPPAPAAPPPYVPIQEYPSEPPAAPSSGPGYPPPPPVAGGYPSAPSGYSPYAPSPYGYGPQPGNNGLAIASLITSIVGFFLTFVGFGWLISIVGVVLGFIALNQIKLTGQSGRGLAIAGIVVGSAMFLLGLLTIMFIGFGLSLLAI